MKIVLVILLIMIGGVLSRAFAQTPADAREVFSDRLELILNEFYTADTIRVSVGGVDNIRLEITVKGSELTSIGILDLLYRKDVTRTLNKLGFFALVLQLSFV